MLEPLHKMVSGWFGDRNLLEGAGIPASDEALIGLLPYRAYDAATGLYVNAGSCGFMLEISPLVGTSEEAIRHLTAAFSDNMPDHSSLQVMLWASPRIGHMIRGWHDVRQDSGPMYADMAAKRAAYFMNGAWTSPLGGTGNLLRDFRVFVAGSIPGSIEKRRIVATAMKRSVKTALENVGVQVEALEPDGFLSILDEWVNPDDSEERPERRWRSIDPLHHQLSHAEGGITVRPHSLLMGDGRYDIRCLNVHSYPEAWAGWQNDHLLGSAWSDFQRVPSPFMLSFSFTVGSETADGARAALKSTRATQKAGTDLARFMPMIREQAAEWKNVAQKIREGHKLAHCYYQAIIYARFKEGDEAEQVMRSIYRGNGWRLARDRYMQLQSFLAALPFMPSEGMTADLRRLGRTKTLLTWSCANLAPVQGEWKGMGAPLMLLIGRRGQPFWWDPFANQEGNYNVAVIGKSGSGKSVFMQELVMSVASIGGQVIVIDDGYSFMNSCQLQEGDFVAFSGKAHICLNPFSMINEQSFADDPEYRENVMTMICGLIQQMCRTRSQTNDLENAHIERAVTGAWSARGRQAAIDDVGKLLQASEDARIADLGQMLAPHMRGGVYERYWNGESTLKVGSHLTVFELSEIKSRKELQALVMMMLMFVGSEAMYHGDRRRRKALVVDEAWDLLAGPASKIFIEGLARRARKYNGALITGTQSANDYYKNEAALAAYENTDWICFLAQKADSINYLKKTGRIAVDEAMERDMKSLKVVDGQFSEVMIHGPGGYGVGRLMLDPYSGRLFSSKAADFENIRTLREQGLSLAQAIERAT